MTAHRYEYRFPVPLRGSRDAVFEALIGPTALTAWFAEYVDVDPKLSGAFRFWGKHTYGAPSEAEATQVITKLEPPHTLGFRWYFLDRDTEVTWSLDEEQHETGNVTMIAVRHDFPSLPRMNRAVELIDDLWRIHTGNLCFYLNGATEVYRPDFTNPQPEVRCEVVIDAPPESVFAALIVPEQIKQWFPAPNPVVEPRVGGQYGFGFSVEKDGRAIEPPPMKILEFVENEKLSITWPDWRLDPDVPDQSVSWQLEDLGGRTRLILTHTGFKRAVDVSDYPFGWPEFLAKIGKVATGH